MNITIQITAVTAGAVLADGRTVLRSFPLNGKGDWRLALDDGSYLTRPHLAKVEVFTHPTLF